MVSTKMAGIKQAGEDVKKLAELIDRFHTLSGLYEAKPKSVIRREKTYYEGSRSLPKPSGVAEDLSFGDVNSVPKPIPPLVQRKGRKLNLQRSAECSKNSTKDSSNQNKAFMPKLHAGKEVDVKVFRLRDSVIEDNVLQSFPVAQEDVKYSFHQPPQVSLSSEASLYQEALASSRKYINLNSRNHALKVHNGNPTFDSKKTKVGRMMGLEKANTIADFNTDRKVKSKHKSSHQLVQNEHESTALAKENSFAREETKKNVESKLSENVSKEMVTYKRKSNGKKTIQSNPKGGTMKTLGPGNSSVTVAADSKTQKYPAKEESERSLLTDLKRGSENRSKNVDVCNVQESIDRIPTYAKMPKFVRSNEEMGSHSDDRNFMSNKLLQDRRQELSANSYYLSTYPYLASLSSVSASEQLGYSPESRISMPTEVILQPRTPANSLQSKTTPSPSPAKSRPITPSVSVERGRDGNRLYPLSSIQRAYDIQAREKISGGKKQHRKPLAGKQGKLRKPASDKDPNLETCVQGHSLIQSSTNAETESQKTSVNEHEETTSSKKVKIRREMSKSEGSASKNETGSTKSKGTIGKSQDNVPPISDVNESFIIRSKHPVKQIARTSSDASDLKTSKLTQKSQGKLAPLMKLNTEMRKSKFILARTEKSISESNQSPVRLMSDPVTFSVRHPSYVSSFTHEEKELKMNDKPSRDLLLGRLNGLHDPNSTNEDTVVVFFHHDPKSHEKIRHRHLQYGKVYKHNEDDTIPESDEAISQNPVKLPPEVLKRKEGIKLSEKPIKFQKRGTHMVSMLEDGCRNKFDELNAHSHLKWDTSAQQLKYDQATFLRLMEQDLLKTPDVLSQQILAAPKSVNFHTTADLEGELAHSPALSSMWKKFSNVNAAKQKLTTYATLASGYPVKHGDSVEHTVKIQGSDSQLNKIGQSASSLNYFLWPGPERRYSYPLGHPAKPPIKSVKSVSTQSDESSTKSVTITDLNLELSSEDRHKHWFMPNLGRASMPLKIQQRLGISKDENHLINGPHLALVALPQMRNTPFVAADHHDRLPDSDLKTFVYFDQNSAAILPDTSTTSYRLAHDVSFDEGSRYRTTDLSHGLKGNDLRNPIDHGLNGLPRHLTSAVAMRSHENALPNGRLDGRSSHRDHPLNNSHVPYKDTLPISLIRMEDRCELPPATSPSSPAMSSAIAASSSSFIPPPSASRQAAPSSASIPSSNITFRLHKEKQNWNYRLGELQINGGGFSNSVPAPAISKVDIDSTHRINMTSAVQRNLQTRERAVAVAPKYNSSPLSLLYS